MREEIIFPKGNWKEERENAIEYMTRKSDDKIVEFCMLVGHYIMVAGLNNSLVALEK